MDLEAYLISEEGERLAAYQDTLGYWTIGVGRLIDARRGGGISQEESRLLLDNDITRVKGGLYLALPWMIGLDEVRRAVLISLAFQLGLAGMLAFHETLSACKLCDWETAATDLLDSTWARQTPARAERAAAMMRSGAWPS